MTKVFTIPFGQPFLATLADGILARFKQDPLLLAKTLVILPTRRGCLGLKEAFQQRRDAQILPRIVALADLEQEPQVPGFIPAPLPPAMPSVQQLGILSQLILKKEQISAATALALAKELMALIDEIHTTDIDIENLQTLVGDHFAQHWQITLDFLKIITDYWPAILAEYQMIEGSQRRRDNLRILAQQWQPNYPVILAGTTATRPATSDLAKAILDFPQGMVILPGFTAQSESLPPTHPLYTLHQFVARLGVTDVKPWLEGEMPYTCRGQLLQQAMSPTLTLPPPFTAAEREEITNDVSMVECRDTEHESLIIALKIREALAKGVDSIVVITPDTELTRRLQIQLKRWHIAANTSQGTLLSKTVVGSFLCLITQFRSLPTGRHLLVLLKHPLCYRHLDRGDHLTRVRQLDLTLRGLKQPNLLASNFLKEEDRPWYEAFLEDIAAPDAKKKESLSAHLQQLREIAETLCLPDKLWAESDGQMTQEFLTAIAPYADAYPPLTAKEFRDLLPQLMDQFMVHDREGIGSPVRILGALEARQAYAPLMILGGLNETTWPQMTDPDPWLNRQMRLDLGLPDPLRRIGLSAHDFCLGFSAPKVMLTRSMKKDGSATVPSRWWLRLETLLSIHKISIDYGDHLKRWASILDQPASFTPASEPYLCPPLECRPTQYSTTDIEQLMRDPFGYCARRILKLRKLELPDQDLSPRELGNLIHESLDTYHRMHGHLKDLEKLLECGKAAFSAHFHDPHVQHFWWPRFVSIAEWLIQQWHYRQPDMIYTEVEGILELNYCPEATVRIKSIADRIDIINDQAIILDYKTGSLLAEGDIVLGLSPQLAIEAILLQQGGFAQIGTKKVAGLEYWYLKGGASDSQIKINKNHDTLIENAQQGLQQLFTHFLVSRAPYLCAPWGKSKLRNPDYLQLARYEEWNA
ncbi:PD-(D/E)XK nuclease family protein [Candidatus Odyssella thessalonicensis]|uniref:PD-(D/E)XK nuclease family protein n=1 Tax=Candidatus Odyssella thessalonicensis TaxID=84647 RepID=UPI000225ABDF|nr:PD-(D/E)XK nuclease family protein [Candidatus Odyssella thessalonicensis]